MFTPAVLFNADIDNAQTTGQSDARIQNQAALQMLTLYAPQAIVADYFFQELSTTFNLTKIKTALRNFFSAPAQAADLRDRVEASLGMALPIEFEAVPDMMDEVLRFKWIEAERAGRDIWAEQNPADPEAHAIRTWFERHFGAWYLARKARASI